MKGRGGRFGKYGEVKRKTKLRKGPRRTRAQAGSAGRCETSSKV
jgi:hypothetical protein